MNKTKRIKQVFNSSSEVFHLWASQTQEHARQGGRISRAFFNGTSCYSYGQHYELGCLVEINGKRVALINNSGYSHTTNKHIREATNATSHMLQIQVDHTFDWEQGLLAMQGKLINKLFDTFNQRLFWSEYKVWDTNEEYGLVAKVAKFNKLVKALGKPELQVLPDALTLQVVQEHVNYRIAREAELKAEKETPEYKAKVEKRKQREINKQLEKARVELDAWFNGGSFTNAIQALPTQLVRVKDNVVETTRRASVPLAIAKRAVRQLEKGTLKRGARIGHYSFTSSDGVTVKIGCHTINLNQAKSVILNATPRLEDELKN